ncbi:CDK5 and ABL1 enzyme substrate 1 [Nematostella vectensis]|uniref:CDK5 and ABL1 enzyme substrate 1 n=1 Tax=Nematostella vectensis TaxID=45351 RepID=UPI0020779AED|nr:CDK5 and ABL1 enzyme substrate 1 [Nematostella vectensis]
MSSELPANMAAASAVASTRDGRPQNRKSRRAMAQSFLSGISLDGRIMREPRTRERNDEKVLEPTPTVVTENFGTPSPVTRDCRKPKYLHSISESAASGAKSSHHRDRSITRDKGLSVDVHRTAVRRSFSVSESMGSSATSDSLSFRNTSRHRITCMSGSSYRLRRKVNDKRVVLCTSRKIPFITYSVLKYHKENQAVGFEGTSKKHMSGPSSSSPAIEGVEIGIGEKSVSYSSLLVPSYPLATYRAWQESMWAPSASPVLLTQSLDLRANKADTVYCDPEALYLSAYDPYQLDDPELTSGKHRTVLRLNSYMVSMTAYAKPSELKKDLNERFREKFPHIEVTLTKLRSLKRDILKVASSQDCSLDLTSVAYAFVYFEKLILKEKINKPNRKLMAGACLLLAAKFNDDKRVKIKFVIDKIAEKMKVQVRELLSFEFQALVGLDFNLHIPAWEVVPHLKRLESDQFYQL